MKTEIYWLGLSILATSLMWAPYIFNSFFVRGIISTIGFYDDSKELSPWAQRAKKAHANAIENLVIFAAAVLSYSFLKGTSGADLSGLTSIYFFARIIHYVGYTANIPFVRTLAFFGGLIPTVLILVNVITLF